MGRQERAIDPAAGPVAAFAHDLRELRRAAGNPTYRELARRAHYSDTTLSNATSGHVLPTLAVTEAFVGACGADVEAWRSRWHAAAAAERPSADAAPEHLPTGPPADIAPDGRSTSTTRTLVWRIAAALAAVTVVVSVVVVSVAVATSAGSRGSPRSPATTAPSRPAEVFSVTLGADCPTVPTATVEVQPSGVPPWSIGTVGGWHGDGCFGEFYFHAGGAGNTVRWQLEGAPVRSLQCLVSIHIANSAHSAGRAHYEVVTDYRAGHSVAVDINQAVHHGDWVGAGPFTVQNGTLRIVLTVPKSSAAEVTAGPIHVYCPLGTVTAR